ncbi:uncharacterized protein JN550_008491 [Neoarthrinium moseri]|uniref:uncharacterized protein n=1 Tax=Neoarthrinium moseri TaxID=1658444 RepID=UPI001FDD39B9|nr:uncharacterized protein JN550_008491 [Neoarthrinium moseri]KAI1864945.1 hypothetical protein JN550_008491 [Neoarthrinium moseri]
MESRAPSFHLFPLLPTELRLKVWHHALPCRTIPFRFKLNLDAWNWASEGDWWSQLYIKAADGPYRPHTLLRIPAVCFANQETYRELRPQYPNFRIRPEAFARVVPDQGVQGSPDQGGGSDAAPHFNRDRDVMHFPSPYLWSGASLEGTPDTLHTGGPGALFLAAALSARHVSVDLEEWGDLDEAFKTLTLAVLDATGPLRSLGFGFTVNERHVRQHRLAPVPRDAERYVLPAEWDQDSVRDLVMRRGVCLLPWFRGGWRASDFADQGDRSRQYWTDGTKDGRSLKATTDGRKVDEGCEGAGGEQEYAVYAVLNFEERNLVSRPMTDVRYRQAVPQLEQQYAMCCSGDGSQNLRDNTRLPFEPWLSVPTDISWSWETRRDLIHGFCLPTYGLPA